MGDVFGICIFNWISIYHIHMLMEGEHCDYSQPCLIAQRTFNNVVEIV
jgi:hypothetical protein